MEFRLTKRHESNYRTVFEASALITTERTELWGGSREYKIVNHSVADEHCLRSYCWHSLQHISRLLWRAVPYFLLHYFYREKASPLILNQVTSVQIFTCYLFVMILFNTLLPSTSRFSIYSFCLSVYAFSFFHCMCHDPIISSCLISWP
jgi:hypothetical protein